MPGELVVSLSIRLMDRALLEATCEEYEEAVDSGRMTEQEAQSNLDALYLGMAVIEFDTGR